MSQERWAYPALFVAILSVSFASIFIRWSDSDPLIIAGYRMLFASLMLAPFAFRERRCAAEKMPNRTALLVIITGVVLAAHFFTFVSSLRYTSVAASTLLVNCHPLVVGAASVLLLKESSKRTVLGVIIGFAGVGFIALSGLGSEGAYGNTLALVGGVMAAIYILAGRVLRRSLGIFTYAFLVYLTASVVLLSSALITGVPLWPYSGQELLIFLALAVVCTILGHTVYNWSLKYLSAPIISTSLLGEPLLAILFALVLLSEVPAWTVVLAAPMVLVGVGLTVLDRRHTEGNGNR